MVDPLPHLLSRLRGLSKTTQKNILLGILILILGMGLFFYFFSENKAYAQRTDENAPVSPEVLDPLHKIGKGIVGEEDIVNYCQEEPVIKKEIINNPRISGMLAETPMEKMVPALNKRKNEVSSYLVAIAKKESDLGKHSPKKAGKECYNYWGYRGKENTTDSGYSCFDSPEHAVEVVGDRIEKLLGQNIDTPQKMVVWKCGRSCAATGGQAAANKWISDVSSYYKKLNS